MASRRAAGHRTTLISGVSQPRTSTRHLSGRVIQGRRCQVNAGRLECVTSVHAERLYVVSRRKEGSLLGRHISLLHNGDTGTVDTAPCER